MMSYVYLQYISGIFTCVLRILLYTYDMVSKYLNQSCISQCITYVWRFSVYLYG